MRISKPVILIALALAGCNRTPQSATAAAPDANRIDCALGGKPMGHDCAMELSADHNTLTVWHPDGGFRRLTITPGQPVAAADGAETVVSHDVGHGLREVQVGGDTYRIPAVL